MMITWSSCTSRCRKASFNKWLREERFDEQWSREYGDLVVMFGKFLHPQGPDVQPCYDLETQKINSRECHEPVH
jgi:hypothetical protein